MAFTAPVRAPFALRCGALLVDYTLLMLPLAVASVLGRMVAFGGTAGRAAADSVMFIGYMLALAFFVLNFVVLAAGIERTVGKWVTGLRIERTDGTARLGFVRACLRHLLGYALTALTFGVGYLLAAVRADGRALHDLVARTIVVRDRGSRRRRKA